MAAYNKVNGVYCCENPELLNKLLKEEWGFEGFITSDFGAVHSTVKSALAGLDLEMPTGKYFGKALENAVDSGEVSESVLNEMLIRRFSIMMKFGLFEHTLMHKTIPVYKDGAKALKIAEEGIVLLKTMVMYCR